MLLIINIYICVYINYIFPNVLFSLSKFLLNNIPKFKMKIDKVKLHNKTMSILYYILSNIKFLF